MILFSDFYEEFVKASGSLPERYREKECAEKLYLHLCELDEKGRLFNLTAITELSDAVNKHVVDSLFAAETVSSLSGGGAATLIDVGSGGGFPAVPIAVACPEVSVTALDATAKKCEFIETTAKLCGVGIRTVPERAEDAVASRRESFDFAVARAVARLNVLAELCAPFVRTGGYFLAMKGSAAEEELREASRCTDVLGLKYEGSKKYEIERGGERRILIFKKERPTPAEYPRRYAKIKKTPL